MRRGRRPRGAGLLVSLVCLVLPGTPVTWSLFSGSTSALPGSVVAARITQPTGSTITVGRSGGGFLLSWPTVTLDDSRPVDSRIMRTGSDGSNIEVCTGADAPVHGSGIDTCTDVSALLDVSYSYTQQPIVRVNGSPTWSVPAGPLSVATRVPRLSFGGAGALVTVNSSAALTVPYPAQTSVGDVLVLVVRSARNRTVTTPAGWTTLVSTGTAGVGDLLVAWRTADAATSVAVSTNTNGVGAGAQVVRYVRAAGYTGTPQSAVTAPLSGSATASAAWTLSGSVNVTANNSTVVSVATVIGANALTVAADPRFGLRSASTATSQNNGFGVGVADALSLDAGTAVSPPAWEQAGTAGAWVGALIAFA